MEYLLILLSFFVSGLVLEWKFRIHLYHSMRERIIVTFLFFVIGVGWDLFAVYRGHWAFPGDGLLGIYFGPLPLEEYLFCLIIPFWIVTLYKIFDRKIK